MKLSRTPGYFISLDSNIMTPDESDVNLCTKGQDPYAEAGRTRNADPAPPFPPVRRSGVKYGLAYPLRSTSSVNFSFLRILSTNLSTVLSVSSSSAGRKVTVKAMDFLPAPTWIPS